jgi:hypothetical protein
MNTKGIEKYISNPRKDSTHQIFLNNAERIQYITDIRPVKVPDITDIRPV